MQIPLDGWMHRTVRLPHSVVVSPFGFGGILGLVARDEWRHQIDASRFLGRLLDKCVGGGDLRALVSGGRDALADVAHGSARAVLTSRYSGFPATNIEAPPRAPIGTACFGQPVDKVQVRPGAGLPKNAVVYGCDRAA